MLNAPTSFPPSDVPRRKRRWGRAIGLAILGLILTGVASHAVWGWRVRSRLDAQVAVLKAAGEPTTLADLETPALPPDENAADDLLKAGALVQARGEASRACHSLEPELPLTGAEIGIISAEVEALQGVFPLIESAAAKPKARWPRDWSTPWILQNSPGLNSTRELANLLHADALLEHQRGRDDLAFRRIELMQAMAQAVDEQTTVVSHLVAVGIRALAAATAEQLAPDMKVGEGSGAVAPARVRAQIVRMLDDRPSRKGLARTLRADRAENLQTIEMVMAGKIGGLQTISDSEGTSSSDGAVSRYVMKPVFLESADILLKLTSAVLREFEASANFPAFSGNPASEWRRVSAEVKASPRLYLLASILRSSSEKTVMAEFRGAADRRLGAVALAARLYAVDHAGALPKSFTDLVPTYLAVTPDDPMAAAGSLWFKASDVDPIIYSVGEDGVDNGGSGVAIQKSNNPEPPYRWLCHDAVMHLKRQPRYIPPPEPPLE